MLAQEVLCERDVVQCTGVAVVLSWIRSDVDIHSNYLAKRVSLENAVHADKQNVRGLSRRSPVTHTLFIPPIVSSSESKVV